MVTPNWEERYKELIEFRKEYPNQWPIRKGKETKLALWCSGQRYKYNTRKLTKEEIDKLNKINFPWISKKNNFGIWIKKYREL